MPVLKWKPEFTISFWTDWKGTVMEHYDGRNITMEQICIFLKAVQLRNFSQVATLFNFTPSKISKTIQSMEDELGITLFIRKPHELTPTPAAMLLADEWRQITGSYDHALRKVRMFQKEESIKILLSFVDSSVQMDSIIKQVIRNYADIQPDVRIVAEKHDMHRSVELINFGMLDLAITNEMELPYLNEHGIKWEKLMDTEVVAYVPRTNPLFYRENIDFGDLKDMPLVGLDSKMHPTYNQWLHALCNSYGFVPNIKSYFRTVRSLVFNLDLQDYIFIGDSITSDWAGNDLKEFILPEKSSVIIAYRKEISKRVQAFKKYLKDLWFLA